MSSDESRGTATAVGSGSPHGAAAAWMKEGGAPGRLGGCAIWREGGARGDDVRPFDPGPAHCTVGLGSEANGGGTKLTSSCPEPAPAERRDWKDSSDVIFQTCAGAGAVGGPPSGRGVAMEAPEAGLAAWNVPQGGEGGVEKRVFRTPLLPRHAQL